MSSPLRGDPQQAATPRGRNHPWKNAIGQMLSITAYPLRSLTIIALDVVALYGLCVYGSRENVTA